MPQVSCDNLEVRGPRTFRRRHGTCRSREYDARARASIQVVTHDATEGRLGSWSLPSFKEMARSHILVRANFNLI